DLVIAPDHRIEPAGTRLRREVAPVLLEGRVRSLRIRRGHPLAAPDALKGTEDGLAVRAMPLEQLAAFAAGLEDAEQEMLGRDVFVAEPSRFLLGELEDALRPRIEGERAALDPGAAAED